MILKLIRFIIMVTGIITLSALTFSYYHMRHTVPLPKTVAEKTILELDFTKPFNEDKTHADFSRGMGHSTFSLHQMIKMIHQAAEDPRILGLVANLGTIHLEMANVQELRDAIKDFRNHGKYAHVHAAHIFNTTLYYLATAFDHITVQPMGDIGFMGFSLESPFLRQFFDKHGIVPSFQKEGRYKGAPEMFLENDFSADNKEQILHLLNNFHHQVVTAVSQERRLSLEKVQQLIEKGPYTSAEAKAEQLVDAVGFYDDARQYIKEKAGKDAVMVHQWEYVYDPLNMKKGFLPLSLNKKPAKIALIYALGSVQNATEKSWDLNIISGRGFHKITQQILKDPSIRAVVLRIDSKGGEAITSEAIANDVKRLKQKGIPVIVSMGNYAASAGYHIAAPADRIFAQPGTITGSIGSFIGKFVTNPAWDQHGIHWSLLKTTDNADMWHSNTDFSPFAKERLKTLSHYTYKLFVEEVAKGRKLSVEQVEQVAQGRVWTGQQALEHKLVDALGGLHEAIVYAKELITDVPSYSIAIEVFPKPRLFMERLLQLGGFIEDDDSVGFVAQFKAVVKTSLKELFHDVTSAVSSVQFS